MQVTLPQVLRLIRIGISWHDLPCEFGGSNAASRRFNGSGTLSHIF